MMDEICTKIAKGMPAILILVCVGAMVGTWMASGTIPMMIYYGVQIVNPKFMLVTASGSRQWFRLLPVPPSSVTMGAV